MREVAQDERMRGHRILVDARTPVNYAMFAPVHASMRADDRVQFSFTASEEPSRRREIFAAAGPGARLVGPARAALTKFDAYLTSDFMWTPLAYRTCRIQMFHGVGGKYGFDAPQESLRAWHRLFFVNRRRLANCIAAGAIDADSPAIRLVGMPKVDCLVDGSLQRDAVLTSLGLDPERPTVLYAPTWSPASSLNRIGIDLVGRLARLPINVVVKLHDRSLDARPQYSGGVDWPAALRPVLVAGRVMLARGADICPLLAGADAMVTDHSSAGFEYLLLDRPLVRIHVPELIERASVHGDYVRLLADVSESTNAVEDTIGAVERALADPAALSERRRAVAADLFYEPGTATARCAAALYEAIELEQPAYKNAPDTSFKTVAQDFSPAFAGLTTRATTGSPVVSAIMPAFNAEPYLRRAVESVLHQTYGDLELLIVDDGSSDGTVALAREYAAKDSRVRVLTQANAGPGPARNTAFRVARGRLFAFLDSDDEWDPRFLSELVAVLDARPDVDVVFGNARNRGGSRHDELCRPLRGDGAPITLAEILADENALFIMAVFRREAVEAVGGFDPAIFTNEEYDLWIRAALAGFTFTRHVEPLGWYSCREDSLSADGARMLQGILRVFAKTRPLVERSGANGQPSPELAIVTRQIARFEAELAAVDAKRCLARGDLREAGRHLTALHALRGGWLVAAAAAVATHAPAIGSAAYRLFARKRAPERAPAPGGAH